MPGVNFQQTFTNTDNSMDTSVSFLMPKPKPTFADLTLINTGPSSFLQQERQSLDDPNQRLFPSVRSSQYGQTNKFNNTVHSKILKDFLNQQRNLNRNLNYGMAYNRRYSAHRKAINKSSIGSQGGYQ